MTVSPLPPFYDVPMTDDTLSAPTITDAHYDDASAPHAVHVSGTTEDPGTVTLYDGEDPVSTTTAVGDQPGPYSFTFTVTDLRSLAPGQHSYSACVTAGTGDSPVTSPWSAALTVTVPSPAPDGQPATLVGGGVPSEDDDLSETPSARAERGEDDDRSDGTYRTPDGADATWEPSPSPARDVATPEAG